jgi:hypothetical protein
MLLTLPVGSFGMRIAFSFHVRGCRQSLIECPLNCGQRRMGSIPAERAVGFRSMFRFEERGGFSLMVDPLHSEGVSNRSPNRFIDR